VGQASEVPVEPVEVQIEEDGSMSIRTRRSGEEFQKIAPEQLVDELQSRITAETPVVLAADGRVPYETVMKAMDQLRSNGITRLGLLVDQSAAPDDQER